MSSQTPQHASPESCASGRAPIPKPERFAWPPGNDNIEPQHDSNTSQTITRPVRRHAADAAGEPSPAHWWNVVEEVWLGVVKPSWEQRCVESRWTPEQHGLWCPKCGHSVGDFEVGTDDEDNAGCSKCRTSHVPWREIVRLGTYGGLLRDAILEIKFSAWRRLASDVGYELGKQLAQTLASRSVSLDDVVLIPTPVAFRRRLLRGIDHTLCITRGVRSALLDTWENASATLPANAAPIIRPLKRKYRPTQTRRDAERRRRNVANSMIANAGVLQSLQGKTIVLIDDVMTTGATIRETCRALGVTGKKDQQDLNIIVAVVAVTDDA